MNFRDRGIIISKRPLKEKSCVVTVFTENNGIYSGVLRQYSKKTGDSLAEGNLVDFFWNARLHEHIGSAKAELVRSFNSHVMLNKTKLFAFNSLVGLLKASFHEREPHNNLFPTLLEFMESLKRDFSFKKYMELELAILSEAGFCLQLDKCAVSGLSENLRYVSPKTGRAVSEETGADYANKLLKLPKFLIEDLECERVCMQEAFRLTSYFFERYVFHNKPQPASRVSFIEHVLDV